MTTLNLPPIEVLASAAAELAAAASEAGDKRNEQALNKAIFQLHAGSNPTPTCGGFLVASATRGGVIHRVSNTYGCNCDAGSHGKPCWHASMLEIIEQAQAHYTVPQPPLGDRLAKARAAADKFNADVFA